MGRNGRKSDSPAMLNMLPKFELVPMTRYFMTLPKARRPSRMPACRTPSPGSRRMISAASLATSTPDATEMPTSAAWSDGASLMPSPRNPTTCPRRFNETRMRFFWAGETRAKTSVSSAAWASRQIAHPIHVVAQQDRRLSEADHRADVARDGLSVARQDLDSDPVAAEGFQNSGGVRARRGG